MTRGRFGELRTVTSESESVVYCSLPYERLEFLGNILMAQHQVRLPAKQNTSRIGFEAFFSKKREREKKLLFWGEM